jgi:outer membrane lipoprotein-sorting protein
VEDRQNNAGGDLLDRATEAMRRIAVPAGPPPAVVARVLAAGLNVPGVPPSAEKHARTIGRIVRFAIAASILVAVVVTVTVFVIGGSSNIAFATVVNVLEHLHSATFDMTMQMTGESRVTMRAKGSFLAPSRQRIEGARKGDRFGDMIIVADYETAKGIVLLPAQRMAVIVDSEKIKDQINNPMTCMFETMRCLVREGRNRSGKAVTPLGRKEIDGQAVVGFQAHCSMGDMTLWADPRTARPVSIELSMPAMNVHGVLNNFHYDMPLDRSLFSLEPPPGYFTQTLGVALPSEDGLIQTLHDIAEQRNGMFPKELGINREVMDALEEIAMPDIAAIAAGGDAQAAEVIMSTLPFEQKYLQGILFYMSLRPENDAHYAGGGVKLGTTNRPIFWYKPTGAERFRVIYADLRVKEMTSDEVKRLPKTEKN